LPWVASSICNCRSRRDLAPQGGILILQVRIEILEPCFFALRLALIEARILPAEIVVSQATPSASPETTMIDSQRNTMNVV